MEAMGWRPLYFGDPANPTTAAMAAGSRRKPDYHLSPTPVFLAAPTAWVAPAAMAVMAATAAMAAPAATAAMAAVSAATLAVAASSWRRRARWDQVYNSTIADNATYVGSGGSAGSGGSGGYASVLARLYLPDAPAATRRLLRAQGSTRPLDGQSYGILWHPRLRWFFVDRLRSSWRRRVALSEGGGLYIAGGNISLYNATVALNTSGNPLGEGVYQFGGSVNGYNTLVAENGYSGSTYGPTGADYYNATSGSGSAVAYYSLIQSVPVGVTNGGGSLVTDAGLDPAGLQSSNGGPTATIALLGTSVAIGAGLNPINGVTLFTDQRGYIPSGFAWSVGAYQPGNPAAAPTATLTAANVSVAGYGQTSYTFTITYSGEAGITPSSLAGAVVTVDPPGGGPPITATVVNTVANGPTDPWGDAQSFTVTYEITPPGGSWTSADNGTYTVELGGSPVTDTDGDTIPTGPLGTFQVQTGKIGITKYQLLKNRKTGFYTGTITLTNNGTSSFDGPIFVLFTLPPGVILENATGTYGGQFYLEVNVGSLAPGASINAVLEFNSNVNPLAYSTNYYLGNLGS